MDGSAAVVGFEDALQEVASTVDAFDKAKHAEGESQKAKNAALYIALDRAFQFHRQWAETHEFEALLFEKSVNAKPRGKNASDYLPTIKLFFDPALDSFEPSGDVEKADKLRRQKMVSTYSRVLEYAETSDKGAENVAEFIKEQGGIEAARVAWKAIEDESAEAKEKASKVEQAKQDHYQTGLALLKNEKSQALPQLDAYKDTVQLAALYVDETGIAHFLGIVPETDSSKGMLERFIRNADPASHKASDKPITALNKLLRLLAVGKAAHSKDANVKIVSSKDRCELWASHGSTQTCMVHAVIPAQDYLPEGIYWFSANVVKAMQHLAKLGRHGAQFSVNGPAQIAGKTASVRITVEGHKEAIKAFDTKAGMISWDWLDAIPFGDARLRTMNPDGTTTIEYKSQVEMLATAKPVDAWEAEIAVEGPFAEWVKKTFCGSRSDADDRLAAASYGAYGNKHTVIRIDGETWALRDQSGDFAAFRFDDPLLAGSLDMTFTMDCGDLRNALQVARNCLPDAPVTVALCEDYMLVRGLSNELVAETFIPNYIGKKRSENKTGTTRNHLA